MYLPVMITRTALSVMLLATATACEATSVNKEAEKAGSTQTDKATKAPKKVAGVGDTVRIIDDSTNVSLSVTLNKVVDPAKPGEFETVPKGKRLIASQFKIKNNSDKEYEDSPSNGAQAIDTTGQAYAAGIATVTNCQEFAVGSVRLTEGDTQIGCVTFEVDKKAVIERIRFGASSGFGSSAEWKVK